MANLTTRLTIKAAVNGLDEIQSLIKKLEEAGIDTTELAGSAGKLQASFNKLSTKQQAADLDKLDASAKKADTGFDKLKTSLMGMAGAYVGVQTVTAGIKELVDTSKQMDSLNQKLEYATGSAKAAGETWDYLKNLANELGLEQVGLANGYAQLASATKNLNLSQADTRTAFEGVANAAAAMSLTTDETNGVMLALSQIAGKGKVSMEELRGQLGERLTPAMGIAAQAMGVTTQELEKMVEQGIDAKEFLPKFGAALTESFGQQAQNNINTTTGAINLIANKLTDLKQKVLDSFAGEAIARGTQFFADTLDKISNAMDKIDPTSIEAVKGVFANLFGVIGTISQTLSGLYTDFNNLFAAMTGFDNANEKVGFLTRTLQGLSVIIGAIDDVFKGLQATANLAIGGILDAFSRLYGVMAKFELLPDGLQEKYQNMSDGLKKASDDAFARLDNNVNEFASSTKKALDATLTTAEQMKDGTQKAVDDAKAKYDDMAQSGKASTDELQAAFVNYAQKAIDANNGVIDATLKTKLAQHNLQAVIDDTGKTVVQAMDSAQKAVDEVSFDALKKEFESGANGIKLDFDKAAIGISDSFKRAMDTVSQLSVRFDDFTKAGIDGTQLLIQALGQIQKKANNKAELDALIDKWQELGAMGQFSTEQLKQGIDGAAAKLDGLKEGINGVTEAYKLMGLKSKAELQAQAYEFKTAYTLIKQSGTATADTLADAFKKYANAAISANGGVADSTLKAIAAQHKLAIQTDQSGKVSVVAQSELKQSIDSTTNATLRLAKSGQLAGDSLSDGAKKAEEDFTRLSKSLEKTNQATSVFNNPFGTMTGVENFLKQAGLDDKQAMKVARDATGGGDDIKNMHQNLKKIAGNLGIQTKDHQGTSSLLVRIAEVIRHKEANRKILGKSVGIDDVMSSFDRRLADERQKAKEEAKQEFMRQLIDENKRRAT